jgi:hypothetical protein
VVNDTSPPKSRRPSLLMGFGIRVCVWLLLIGYAAFTYFVGPQIEKWLLDRGMQVSGGVILAFRTSHLVNVYFILFAMLVIIDGVGSLVVALTRVAYSVSRTWSRLMWVPSLCLHATILGGALFGAFQVLAELALR